MTSNGVVLDERSHQPVETVRALSIGIQLCFKLPDPLFKSFHVVLFALAKGLLSTDIVRNDMQKVSGLKTYAMRFWTRFFSFLVLASFSGDLEGRPFLEREFGTLLNESDDCSGLGEEYIAGD